MQTNTRTQAATRILSKALGVLLFEDEIDIDSVVEGAMNVVPYPDGTVSVVFTLKSGDRYQLVCRWLEEESP